MIKEFFLLYIFFSFFFLFFHGHKDTFQNKKNLCFVHFPILQNLLLTGTLKHYRQKHAKWNKYLETTENANKIRLDIQMCEQADENK